MQRKFIVNMGGTVRLTLLCRLRALIERGFC